MKNKKIYALIFLIIILILMIIFEIINLKRQKDDSNKNNELEQSTQEIMQEDENQEDVTINIKSDSEHPIKLDEIEATNIEIKCVSNTLQVFTTLKNNSNEKLDDFYIEMELLDENENKVTTLYGKVDGIEAHSEKVINNNVTELNNGRKICKAKIVSIEKETVEDIINSSIDELENKIQKD